MHVEGAAKGKSTHMAQFKNLIRKTGRGKNDARKEGTGVPSLKVK